MTRVGPASWAPDTRQATVAVPTTAIDRASVADAADRFIVPVATIDLGTGSHVVLVFGGAGAGRITSAPPTR